MELYDTVEWVVSVLERSRNFDPETAHVNADHALCELLIELGFEEIVELWRQVPKWYA